MVSESLYRLLVHIILHIEDQMVRFQKKLLLHTWYVCMCNKIHLRFCPFCSCIWFSVFAKYSYIRLFMRGYGKSQLPQNCQMFCYTIIELSCCSWSVKLVVYSVKSWGTHARNHYLFWLLHLLAGSQIAPCPKPN